MRKVFAKGLAWKTTALAAIVVALMVGSVLLVAGAPTSGASASTAGASQAPSAATSSAPVSAPGYGGPHPGTIQAYEIGGPGTTEDPAVAYDTVSYEPILNVYQTLMTYNGSSVANFVPELALCVPGSAQCSSEFGSTLITTNATTGFPATYTFVIDPAANFYDPTTGASWGVYPSDVMFSLARTMSFADLPFAGLYNGWIITQALVPAQANASFAGGIHTPYNNTPYNILSSMLVNDSAYCPSVAMSQDHGCITFVTGENGAINWPYFLTLILDPLGASVVPAGAFTYNGAGVPGFPGSAAAYGDGPSLLPGNATSTSDAGFQAYLSSMEANPTAWNDFQNLAAAGNYAPQPWAQWNMIGSGPYYATGTINPNVGYFLEANPAYVAPTGCAGQVGCEPMAGTYQPKVAVSWQTSDATSISEIQAGQADFGGIELPAHIATFNQLYSKGLMDFLQFPGISIFFQPFALQFDVATAQSLAGTAGTINVPGDFMSYLALRQFIINAVPYLEVNSTLLSLSGGVQIGFGYGGAIPKTMADPATGQSYYNYSIPWQGDLNKNPDTNASDVGSAAWWWAQGNDPTSAYYDPELAACTSSSPCSFPLMGEIADTFHDAEIAYLISEMKALSNGALDPFAYDLTFHNLIIYCAAATPGTSGCPLWNLGWAPDYPDPTDYWAPMYAPDQIYTAPDAVAEALSNPAFNLPTCPYAGQTTMAAMHYYDSVQVIPSGCQGVVYNISTYWADAAGAMPQGAARVAAYHDANYLMYLLGLYVWNFQANTIPAFGPWIDGSTINENPTVGGGGDIPWYAVGYTKSYTSYNVTVAETGLPAGTSWTFSLKGATPLNTTSPSIALVRVNGTYDFTVTSSLSNYTVISPAGGVGTFTVNGADVLVPITFGPIVPSHGIEFVASGLGLGATWSVTMNGVTQFATAHNLTIAVSVAGTYTWYASATGYSATPSGGNVNYTGSPVPAISIAFAGTVGSVVLNQLPSSYNLWVNGVQVASGATNTSYSLTGYSVGMTVAYEVQASGYNTYFNNVTIAPGTSTIAVGPSMTSSSSSTPWSYLSTFAYIIIAVLAVLVVIFIVTTAMARGGRPPAAQPPETWKGSDTGPSEPPK